MSLPFSQKEASSKSVYKGTRHVTGRSGTSSLSSWLLSKFNVPTLEARRLEATLFEEFLFLLFRFSHCIGFLLTIWDMTGLYCREGWSSALSWGSIVKKRCVDYLVVKREQEFRADGLL